MNIYRFSILSIVALLSFLLGGCEAVTTEKKADPALPTVAVTGVSLNHSTLPLLVGEKDSLTATVVPLNAGNQTLSWSSDAPAIATASDGIVTAVGLGTATITATTTDGGKKASCVVEVGTGFAGSTLNILSMSDEFKTLGVIADFEALTGAKVNLTVVPNEAYLNTLKPLLVSGTGVPDIFVGEAGFIKEVVNLGMSEDLSASPYNADTSDQYPYAAQMGRDKDGVLRGLSWQTTPGGLFYRRSIAKVVFGTDDPAQVGKHFATWDDVLASGKTLADAGYALLPGVSDLGNVFFAGKTTPFFDQTGKYSLDPVLTTYFNAAKVIRDGGMDAKLGSWSADWMAGMNTKPGAAKIFSYLWPTWGLFYVMNGQKESLGDWAVTTAPTGWYWGGTWMNLYKNSPNKTLAWKFIRMMTQNKVYMEKHALRSGDFTSNRTVVAKIKGQFASTILAGQNHYEFFAKSAEMINASGVSAADTVVNAIVNNVLNDYLDGKITTVDLAMAEITSRVKLQYPNATYP